MKKIVAIAVVLFISFTVKGINNSKQLQEKKIVATYTEFTDDGQFKFTDASMKVLLFDEVSEDVKVDLYDDANIGKKFTVSWEEYQVNVYDEDGEETGEKQTMKRITKLEETE